MFFNNTQKIFIDRVSNDCLLSDNKFVKIYNFLKLNNYEFLDNYIDVDIVILDLCGVNAEFLDKTYKKIELYLLNNKKIILLGCISNIFKVKYGSKILYVDSNNIKKIEEYFIFNISIFDAEYYINKDKITILDTDSELKNYKNVIKDFNKTGFISISDGCLLNCTYCNIKKIKGDTVSVGIDKIIEDISNEVEAGKKDIYLLSDDCGSYGFDIGKSLVNLLDEIFKLDLDFKIHITNIYPLFLLKYYDQIKKYIYADKIAFMLVPIQHTSKRILGLMNRKYDIQKIFDILGDIKLNSNTKLMNHIIFDYHEESINEFVDTFKSLKYYDQNFYFRYSDVNNLFTNKFISYNLKDKVILLKKLQKKYNIDITL